MYNIILLHIKYFRQKLICKYDIHLFNCCNYVVTVIILFISDIGAVLVSLRNRKVFVSKDDLNIEFSEKSDKICSSNFINPADS